MNAEDQAIINNGRIEVYNEIEHANIECFGSNPDVLKDKIPIVMSDFHAAVDKLLTLDEKHFDQMTEREQADCFIASGVVEAVIEKVRDFLPETPVEITDKCGITRVYENTKEHFDTARHPGAISENRFIESNAGERIRDFYSDYNGDRDDTQMRQNYTEMFTSAEINDPQIETLGRSRVEANPDYNSFLSSVSNEEKIAQYHEFVDPGVQPVPDVERNESGHVDTPQEKPASPESSADKPDKSHFDIDRLSSAGQRTIQRISSPDFKEWFVSCDHKRTVPEERSRILERAISGNRFSVAKLRSIYIQVTTGEGKQEPYSKYMAADLGKLVGEIAKQDPDRIDRNERPHVETREQVNDDVAKWIVNTFNFAAQELYADKTEAFIEKAGGEKGLRDYQEARSEFIHALGTGDREAATRYSNDLEQQISSAERTNGSRLEINDRTGSGLFASDDKLSTLGEKAIYGTDGRVARLNQTDPWQAWSAFKYAATATFTSKEDWKEHYGTEKTVGFGSMVVAFGNFAQSLSGTGIFKTYASAAFSGMLSYADRMEKDTPVSQPDSLPESREVVAGVSHAVYNILEHPDSDEAQALRSQIGNDRFDAYTDNLRQYLDTGDRTYLDRATEALGTEVQVPNDTDRNPPQTDTPSSYAQAIDKLREIDASHNKHERIEGMFSGEHPEQQTTGRYRLDTRDTVEVWKAMSAYWKGLTSDDPSARMDFRLSGRDPDMGKRFTAGGMFMMVNAFVSTDIGYTIVKHVFEKIVDSVKDIEAHSEKGVINTILDTIENDFGDHSPTPDVSTDQSDPVSPDPVSNETNPDPVETGPESQPSDNVTGPTEETKEGKVTTDDLVAAADEESQDPVQTEEKDETHQDEPSDVSPPETVETEQPQSPDVSGEPPGEKPDVVTDSSSSPVSIPDEPSPSGGSSPSAGSKSSDIPSYFSTENTTTTQELYDKLHEADPSITPEAFCDQLSAEFCSQVDSGLKDPSECGDFITGLTEFYNACPDSIAHDMTPTDMFDTYLSNITGSDGEKVFASNPTVSDASENSTPSTGSTPVHDYSSVTSGEGVSHVSAPVETLPTEGIRPDVSVPEPISVESDPVGPHDTNDPPAMVSQEGMTPGEDALSSFMTDGQGNVPPTSETPLVDTSITPTPDVDTPPEVPEEPVIPEVSIEEKLPEQPVSVESQAETPIDMETSQVSTSEGSAPPVTTSDDDPEDFDIYNIDVTIPDI